MASCKKRVYKTMCEKDDKGYRTGKYRGVSYKSVRRGGRMPKEGRK